MRESYAQDLLDSLDVESIRERGFRIVVDYGYSAASFVLPLVVGSLGVEAVSAHGFFADDGVGGRQPLAQTIGRRRRSSPRSAPTSARSSTSRGERLFLVDEQGHDVPVDQALLLFVSLLAERGTEGKLAFPVTVTSKVDELAGDKLEIVRTPNSLDRPDDAAAAEEGVVFAGAVGGGYVFPTFLPAYDAVASLAKLLELLAPSRTPLSELVAALPEPTLVHRRLACPWAKKGLVMRVLNERMAGRDVDLTDGIKVLDERGWSQVAAGPGRAARAPVRGG